MLCVAEPRPPGSSDTVCIRGVSRDACGGADRRRVRLCGGLRPPERPVAVSRRVSLRISMSSRARHDVPRSPASAEISRGRSVRCTLRFSSESGLLLRPHSADIARNSPAVRISRSQAAAVFQLHAGVCFDVVDLERRSAGVGSCRDQAARPTPQAGSPPAVWRSDTPVRFYSSRVARLGSLLFLRVVSRFARPGSDLIEMCQLSDYYSPDWVVCAIIGRSALSCPVVSSLLAFFSFSSPYLLFPFLFLPFPCSFFFSSALLCSVLSCSALSCPILSSPLLPSQDLL